VKRDRAPDCQAKRIISRCGGPQAVADMLGYRLNAIYKWTYPWAKYGTGGLVPGPALAKLMHVARLYGILFTEDDLQPRKLPV
jgi:hypothetical protein